MTDYSFTKHRIFQWLGIILALGIIAVGYWWYQSQASTIDKSPTSALDSGLTGYWALDDGSGTNATDSSTNGTTGSLENTPTWTTGQVGGALSLNGTNQDVSLGTGTFGIPSGANSITLSAWVNPTAFVNYSGIISKGTTTNPFGGWQLNTVATTNQFDFALNVSGTWRTMSGSGTPSPPTYTTGSWYLVTGTYDGVTMRQYINGVQVSSYAVTGTIQYQSSSASTYIGKNGCTTCGTNPYFNGKIDEVRIYNRALSADEVSQLYRLSTPTGVDTGLKGYWSFNGRDISGTTAYDRSGSGLNGTLTSGPVIVRGKVGQALDFDGTDDYVTITDTDDTKYTGALTLCTWAKIDTGGAYRHFMGKHTGNGGTQNPFDFRTSNDTIPRLNLIRANTDSKTWIGPVVTLGQWKHYCVVAPSTIQTAPTFYIDGAAAATPTATGGSGTGAATGSGAAIRIGVRADDVAKMDGSMDEVRIYNRMLSAGEIASLYALGQNDQVNSSVSQPGGTGRLDSGLAGYWKLDDGSGTSATDSSINGVAGTLTNGPTWTTGQIGSAVDFDGTDDYIELGSSVRINNADRGTFATWIKIDTNAASSKHIFGYGGAAAASAAKFTVYVDGTLDTIGIEQASTNGGTYNTITGSTALGTATWYHVAVVSNGSTWTIYVNGNVEALTVTQGSNNGNWLGDTSPSGTVHSSLGVAYYNGAYSSYIDAKLDEVRLYDRALSSDEIGQLYRLAGPTPVDTSLKGYWSFNGSDLSGTTAYDRSGAGNTGTLTNSPAKVLGKLGQALSFDGSDDNVDISDFVYSGQVTFATWFYTSNNSQTGIIFGDSNGFSSTGQKIGISSGNFFVRAINAGSSDTSVAVPTASQWHQLVVTRDGSNKVDLYVDGGSANRLFTDAAQSGTNTLTRIGCNGGDSSQCFTGKLDEIRVYNRALSATEIATLYNQGR